MEINYYLYIWRRIEIKKKNIIADEIVFLCLYLAVYYFICAERKNHHQYAGSARVWRTLDHKFTCKLFEWSKYEIKWQFYEFGASNSSENVCDFKLCNGHKFIILWASAHVLHSHENQYCSDFCVGIYVWMFIKNKPKTWLWIRYRIFFFHCNILQ